MRFLFLIFVALPCLAWAAEPWEFRTVEGRVLDEEDRPVAGITVYLVGLGRDAVGKMADEIKGKEDLGTPNDQIEPAWKFVTDKEGRFTARFGNFRSFDYWNATHQSVPGWGGFHFVTWREGYAGGVSPYLQNEGADRSELEHLVKGYADEWRRGEFQPVNLAQQPVNVVIRLKRGITLHGQVVSAKGDPLPGQEVSFYNDLHAWTHTGYGDEILGRNATTDEEGNYRIEHCYPNAFYLRLSSSTRPRYWFKTRIGRGAWVEDRVDEIEPREREKKLRVDFMTLHKPPYRYYGRVSGWTGNGIPNAKVTFGVSTHWPIRTWGDDHHFESVVTNEDGVYEIRLESQYVRFISVTAPGHATKERGEENTEALPPGKYDFRLR